MSPRWTQWIQCRYLLMAALTDWYLQLVWWRPGLCPEIQRYQISFSVPNAATSPCPTTTYPHAKPFPLIFAIKVKIEKMQAEAFSLYVFGLICLAVVSVSIFVISSANMTHPTRNIAMELLQLNSTTTFYSLNIHKVDDWRQLHQQWRSSISFQLHKSAQLLRWSAELLLHYYYYYF